MAYMFLKIIDESNRQTVNKLIKQQWFSTDMVVRGKVIDLTEAEGIVAYEKDEIIGLVTYEITGAECEILSLDSFKMQQGVGSKLMEAVIQKAREKACKKVKLITTNDNLNAMRFYQKRGFDMVRLYHNALEVSRKLKPSIPEIGEDGIPLRHEIEFEMILDEAI